MALHSLGEIRRLGNRGVDRPGHALPPQQGVAKVLLRPLVVTKAGGRHAELMEDERIIECDLKRLAEELLGQMCVVGEAKLEHDVELGQVTARHQLTRLGVGRHRLVVLVLVVHGALHLAHALLCPDQLPQLSE